MTEDDEPAFALAANQGENGQMLVRDNGMGVEEVVGVHCRMSPM